MSVELALQGLGARLQRDIFAQQTAALLLRRIGRAAAIQKPNQRPESTHLGRVRPLLPLLQLRLRRLVHEGPRERRHARASRSRSRSCGNLSGTQLEPLFLAEKLLSQSVLNLSAFLERSLSPTQLLLPLIKAAFSLAQRRELTIKR
jgi:hypothetical protein